MIRIGIALAATLGSIGCGEADGAGNNAAALSPQNASRPAAQAAPSPPPAPPQVDLAGARALIDRIYTPYTRDQMADLGDIYTPALNRSIDRQSDPDMGLGYDPFCSCQDFGDFAYTVQSLEPAADGARARIERSNFGERSVVTLDLAFSDGRWRVADITDSDGSLLNRR